MNKPKVGWMDSTAFSWELSFALGGVKIYPDEADLREHAKCIDQDEELGEPCRAKRVYVFDADAYDATKPNPTPTTGPNEAIAGIGATPVGEKRQPSGVGEPRPALSGETGREFIVNEVTQQLGRIAKTLNGGEYEQLITHTIMPIATRTAIRAYEDVQAAELNPNDAKHSNVARLEFWKGRLAEFVVMKSQRPIDPCYWDMHHEREIREAIAALTTPSPTEGANSPADARTELVQTEVGEGLREALGRTIEKLREQAHASESPYYTKTPAEPTWEFVAKAFTEIADELEAALAAPAPKLELTSRDCICPTTCDGPEYNLKILPNCPWHSRAPKPAPPAEPDSKLQG